MARRYSAKFKYQVVCHCTVTCHNAFDNPGP